MLSSLMNLVHKNQNLIGSLSQNTIQVFNIFKYDAYFNNAPYIQSYFLSNNESSFLNMLLDVLFYFKNNKDQSLSFRRSCREGICGSCAMNINGINTLACTYHLNKQKITNYIFPLPHLPIVKDLVVSMTHFFEQYKSIQPFLKLQSYLNYKYNSILNKLNIQSTIIFPKKESLQDKSHRDLLNGLYECILCACCSSSCPSYWWNRDKYLGPAVLLQSYRWIIDSRDDAIISRLNDLSDLYSVSRCHQILNCVQVCPKKLSPFLAISHINTLFDLQQN